MRPCDFEDATLDTWIGRVEGLEPITGTFDCRNNRLAQAGLEQDDFAKTVAAARARYGASRIGVFLGTSTSGILQTERAYQNRDPVTGDLPESFQYRYTQSLFSVTDFVRRYLALEGPAMTQSTACSSSAKVFATAYRHIQAGFCDAAVVGGVDSLCLTTLYGFNSLELVSKYPCQPWDLNRRGMNIGEAAGFALLEVAKSDDHGVALLGYGESGDAYHISTPHPQGLGAALAMQRALDSAGVEAKQVDYINLHGTGTRSNDASEDKAVTQVFGTQTPCSSTKGWTGHTLGAAGITEAVFACLCLEHQFLPKSLNTHQLDPELLAHILLDTQTQPVNRVMSNSFGFGGSNCSLLFGRLM
jgi:3-oxoacyl-[acyl-carrier-protein] synthase-1